MSFRSDSETGFMSADLPNSLPPKTKAVCNETSFGEELSGCDDTGTYAVLESGSDVKESVESLLGNYDDGEYFQVTRAKDEENEWDGDDSET